MTEPVEASPRNRISTLDGWRCVAILMVLESHFLMGFMPHSGWTTLGHHGVQVFFVLSGFLITTNLLGAQPVDLRRFYVRRFFRLMPAAWAYLGFLGLLTITGIARVLDSSIWSCLFFYRNYFVETVSNTCTSHFWSLSLEEQFYLVWPPLLVFAGRRRAILAAAGAICVMTLYRILFWSNYIHSSLFLHTELRSDGLLTGCILAILLEKKSVKGWVQSNASFLLWGALPILAWDFCYFKDSVPLHETILIAISIACTSLAPHTPVSRVLEWQHIKSTGLASYSIYLWQGLFFRSNWGFWGMLLFPIAFMISWLYIERPGIRLGRRIFHDSPVPSAPSPDTGAVAQVSQ